MHLARCLEQRLGHFGAISQAVHKHIDVAHCLFHISGGICNSKALVPGSSVTLVLCYLHSTRPSLEGSIQTELDWANSSMYSALQTFLHISRGMVIGLCLDEAMKRRLEDHEVSVSRPMLWQGHCDNA